jgi:hypothetical protein
LFAYARRQAPPATDEATRPITQVCTALWLGQLNVRAATTVVFDDTRRFLGEHVEIIASPSGGWLPGIQAGSSWRLGAVSSRVEARALRLAMACIRYDGAHWIGLCHLEAAPMQCELFISFVSFFSWLRKGAPDER